MRFACMQVCGVTKQKCDIQFKKCTDKACRKQPFITTGGEPKECKTVIGLKVAMAQMEQCNDFEAAQKRACKCKKESKVDRARRKFLTKFYAKFATKKPDVDSLMEKHGSTPRKFSDLVIKLMKKYSKKVVKRVADPMQERMNEILRKMREQEAAGKMGKKNSDSEPDGGAYDDYDEEEDEFDYKEEGNSPPKRSKKKKKVQRAVEEEEIELTDDDGHQEL